MTPEAKAIIDNATALDQKYNDIGQELAGANASNALLTTDKLQLRGWMNALGVTVMRELHLAPFVADPNARPLLEWFQPGPTGNSNPKPTDPHGSWNMTDANGVRTISIAPAAAYNDFIFPINLVKGDTSATKYAQLVTFEVPDAAVPFCMAIETNWEHSLGGFRYNQGTQFLIGADREAGKQVSGVVRYFDIAGGGWHTLANVPLPPVGTGKPITVLNEVQRVPGGMTFVAVTVNGTRYPVGITTKAVATNWGAYLQGAVQLDTTGSAKGYSMLLRDAQAAWA